MAGRQAGASNNATNTKIREIRAVRDTGSDLQQDREIRSFSKNLTVISEVGSKQKDKIIPDDQWVMMMKSELDAGSVKVIAEARESGTVGIYNSNGSANENLIKTIASHIDPSDILWEAPEGKQQVWFIKLYGANVNLGNIAPNIVVPLECLRIGLRGDTFFDFLPDELKSKK